MDKSFEGRLPAALKRARRSFRYSEVSWKGIAELIPDGGAGDARDELEVFAHLFMQPSRRFPSPLTRAKKYDALAVQADRLIASIERRPYSGNPFFASEHALYDAIADLSAPLTNFAAVAVIEASKLRTHNSKRSNRADPRRDRYLNAIVEIWRNAGGKLTTTFDPVTNETRGDVLKFLELASAPVFAKVGKPMPSPNALRHVVRAYRR